MHGNTKQPELAPVVRRKLRLLRWRIRWYVWQHGLSSTVAWMAVAFWISLGADWLLEPPLAVRRVLLGIIGLTLAWMLFWTILRRAFARLSDRNMAMLLERRFPQFDESLLTAVELTGRPGGTGMMPVAPWHDGSGALGEHHREMLARTCRQAAEPIGEVRLREVLNPLPLYSSAAAAILLAATVASFGLLVPEVFSTWARRSLFLRDELWPRRTRLVVDGFPNGVAKVARGDDVEVIAKADLSMPVVPNVVEVRYRSGGAARLRAPMSREGRADPARERFQEYSHTFRGVLAPITFDVVGGDAAVRDLRIEPVDSPTIVEMTLDCRFPDYMDRTPRSLPVSGVMQLPRGTRVTVRAVANKDLVKVEIDDGEISRTHVGKAEEEKDVDVGYASAYPNTESEQRVMPKHNLRGFRSVMPKHNLRGFRSFAYTVPDLTGDKTLLFTLFDTDGIRSRRPARLALRAVPDEPPQLSIELRGIGSAITPQARLPAAGRVTDDYGIARIWFEAGIERGERKGQSENSPPKKLTTHHSPLTTHVESPPGNVTDFQLDHALEARDLKLTAGQRIQVCVKAADRYALEEQPNVGTSRRWLLDVVTPDELRTMLESRELVLRQRFEQIIEEVTETRDSLARIDFRSPADENREGPADSEEEARSKGAEPSDEPGDADDEQLSLQRALALRTLRVGRALQDSRKSAHETLAVAQAFVDIRAELVNNRVDTAELKMRLQYGIVDPLMRIVEELFPELDRRLDRLEATLAADAGPESRQVAVEQTEAVLSAMRQVLGRMLELEDFGKVVELLRQIIHEQERLGEQTRQRHKQKLRELLED